MKALRVDALIKRCSEAKLSDAAIQELIAHNAEQALFDAKAAFRKALMKVQQELPIIEKTQEITYKDGRVGSYAPNDIIQEIVQPILRKHGFVLTFKTTYPQPGTVNVRGELAHKDGYEQYSSYEAKVDFTGGKTDAQGRGSVIAYGHRYTTKDLLNLIERGVDNDGRTAQSEIPQDATADTLTGIMTLHEAARLGSASLESAWSALPSDVRSTIPDQSWRDAKAIAEGVDAGVF